jgi:hypothetical protein
MILELRPSPNQSPRIHGDAAVRLIVVHTPEGGYDSTLAFVSSPRSKVSYHRMYSKDGSRAVQMVPWDQKAWHAGAVNSLSDGISIEGFARLFNLHDPGVLEAANGVAERLVVRKLPCQWTTDPMKGGFCRHGDLQADRSDPTPDLAEWRLFGEMVQVAYKRMTAPAASWPRPIPKWFWAWAAWRLGGSKGARPATAPKLIPAWAWRRLAALQLARRK